MDILKKTHRFLFALLLVLSMGAQAQKFEKRYNWDLSTTYFAEVTACEHLSNGHNIIAIHQRLNSGQGAAALAEITTHGDTLWTKKFNRAGTTYGENIIDFIKEMPDHSFFLAGRTHNSSGFFHAAFWLADANGNITSYKQFTYNTYRDIFIHDIDVASDGSIYFAGLYNDLYSGGSTGYSWTVPLYGKLNPDLSLAWGKTWGSTNHAYNYNNVGAVYGIKITPDNNLIVMGSNEIDNYSGYLGTLQLAKVTTGGVVIWTKQRSLVANSYPVAIDLAPNGEIYSLTRLITNTPYGGYDLVLEKFTSAGNPIWSKSYGSVNSESIDCMKFNTNSNRLVLAGNSLLNNTFYMALQATIDTAGTLLQSKIYGETGTNYNYLLDVVPFGSNYLFVGNAYTYGGMLIQTDADGNTGCAANNFAMSSGAYASNPYTVGISHNTMPFTFTTYTANYINNPITSSTSCYACSDVTVTNNVSAYGSYFVGGALQTASGTYTDVYPIAGGCDSTVITNLTINLSLPAANFTASFTSIFVGQSVNFTDLTSNAPTAWNWTFNGATPSSSTLQNPSSIVYNTPGCYTVTLTATNPNGNNTHTVNCYITVNPIPVTPVANFIASTISITAGQSVNFSDLSTNTPTVWNWSFPGAATTTSTLQNPTNIVYNTPGCYQVTLTASNAAGSDSEIKPCYINVNPIVLVPVANFTSNTTVITVGQSVNFTDLSTNTPTAWSWSFTGAATSSSTLQNPSNIVYNTPGCYQVSLTASNSAGNNTKTTVCYITVNAIVLVPVANFSASSLSITTGQSVNFTDLSTNAPTSWSWTFTGASPASSTTQNPSNITYNTAGCYQVSLTVTNSAGSNTKTLTCYITVSNPVITPVANFTANTFNITTGQSVNFTDLSTNNPTSWSWTFTGASPASSTTQNPSNIVYNTAGCYQVSLTVTNSAGSNTKTMTCYITVTAPNLYCIPVPTNGTSDGDFINSVTLGSISNLTTGSLGGPSYSNYSNLTTNLSTYNSYTLTVQNGTYANDTIAAWIDYNNDNDFNDVGEKLDQINTFVANSNNTINFTVPGSTAIGTKRLRVRIAYNTGGISNMDPCTNYGYGETEDYSVNIVAGTPLAPVANFTANALNISAGQSINFTDLSTNSPSNWSWTFTGATPSSSTSQNPIGITYNTPGCYQVALTASNAGGSNTSTQTCYINVIAAAAPCTELFFSEYIEGVANDKALEIYNPSGAAINLTGYSIEMYANGAVTPTASLSLSGSIPSHDVYVIANTTASATILGIADMTTNGVCNFNGNDAVVLKKNGIIIDVIGEVGVNPGTAWTVGTGSTLDNTLVRNASVNGPNNLWANGQTQYTSYAVGTTSYLGTNTNNCAGVVVAPVASFTSNTQSITTGQSVNFTDLSTNNPTSWTWTFTGGSPASSNAQNPTNITYNTPGCYQVSLTATNSAGSNTSTQSCYITVTNAVITPVANFTASTFNITTGQSVNFTDLSTNNPTSWSWTFTGGSPASSTSQNPTNITYNTAGCYQVSLTATNSAGSNTSTQTCYITVTNPVIVPVANFTASSVNITTGQSVNFTDLSTNNPTSWSWTFTGGTPASSIAQNPTNITYNTAGCYQVSLTATNSAGSNTSTQTCYITVTNPVIVPVANFTASSVNITTG
jgi:PKD repeat protein